MLRRIFLMHSLARRICPRPHYSTEVLPRLLETVSQIWRGVTCSGGNSTCICQGKHFLPCVALSKRRALRSDRRPHAAIMEKQSRSLSAAGTNMLTDVIAYPSPLLFLFTAAFINEILFTLVIVLFMGVSLFGCSIKSSRTALCSAQPFGFHHP